MSQITTHILDTSLGKPAQGIGVSLERSTDSGWESIGSGQTNADGRVADLLKPDETLSPGIYRINFDTGTYFASQGFKGFYPSVNIVFETVDDSHYHVPLLLSPFGYSTYRGS